VVFFLGPGLLEVSGHTAGPPGQSVMIWIQVRDVHAEHARLAAAAVPIVRGPAIEPWGLTEMWIQDPDGIQTVLVEVPADHPLRRDPAIGVTAKMTNSMRLFECVSRVAGLAPASSPGGATGAKSHVSVFSAQLGGLGPVAAGGLGWPTYPRVAAAACTERRSCCR
jgi:hypothetical protein